MLSIVYWLYQDSVKLPGPAREYRTEYVNIQRAMLQKYCSVPHRVVCVTDHTMGLDPRIEAVPMPVKDDGPVLSDDPLFPRCYRRLWNFSLAARELLGDRILALDIDGIIKAEIAPLLERDEDLVVWRAPHRLKLILGGAYLLRTGSHTDIWNLFDFERSPVELLKAKKQQSDQGWLNHMLPASTPAWTEKDGLYVPPLGRYDLPEGVRIVSFGGPHKPWMESGRRKYPWIEQHWNL